jgi:hypothetical protein
MRRFDSLGDQIAASLDVSDAILDGAVIAADETGRPQFYDLLRDTRAPAYVAFDVLWLNGTDLRLLPLSERRRHLKNILPKGSAIISEALSVAGRGCELFELMCAHDLEGVVAKRLKDPYGSRVRWLKIKNPRYSQNEGRRELFDRSAGTRDPQAPTSEATAEASRIVTSHNRYKRPSLERAFTLGNELIAASERINDAAGWPPFVAQTGLSARSVRRYIVLARWANEHTEDFAALLRMRRRPSFLRVREFDSIARSLRAANATQDTSP